MQTLANRTEALLSGARGTLDTRYRLYRSSIAGEKGDEIRGVSLDGAQVTLSNFRDNTWELSLTVERPDVIPKMGDWVRVYAEVRDGASWITYPLSLYKLDPAGATHNPLYSTYEVSGRSPEVVLSENAAYLGYTVAAGAGVLATVRTIMQGRGIPNDRIVLPTVDVTLPAAMSFSPLQDFSSTYYLRIVNSILNAGGFRALFADAEGRLTTESFADNESGEADVTYASDSRGVKMISGDIGEERDYESFANRVVVYAADSDTTVPVIGVAENRDPDSDGSIGNLGRVVQGDPLQVQVVVSQQVANMLARAQLRRVSAYERKLNLSTFPDPRRDAREVYRLYVSREDGVSVAAGLWDVIGWSLPLQVGAPMTHELSRRVSLL